DRDEDATLPARHLARARRTLDSHSGGTATAIGIHSESLGADHVGCAFRSIAHLSEAQHMIASQHPVAPLPVEHLEQLEGWAMVRRAAGFVWRPESVGEIRSVFEIARQTGRTIAPRGTGYSYNDAALNAEDIVLDLSRMNRLLDWDPRTGIITM